MVRRLGYRPELDGLRGLAVLAVMAFHSGLISGGWLGVDVFFALSGFLITRLLVDEHAMTGGIKLGWFYARRGLRLFPALLTLVVVLALILIATIRAEQRIYLALYVGAVLLYVANWVEPFGLPLAWGFGHTWSLAIEEQFYLAWPLGLVALLRLGRRRITITLIVAGSAAAVFAYRMILAREGVSPIRLLEGSDTRADSLLIGCAVALVSAWELPPTRLLPSIVARCVGLLAFVGLIVLFLSASISMNDLGLGASTVAALCAGLVILDLLAERSLFAPLLRTTPLVAIGRISYGLYLWHFPIFFALDIQSARPAGPWIVAAGWAATLGVALVSFFVIETPALRVKLRLTPRDDRSVDPLFSAPARST